MWFLNKLSIILIALNSLAAISLAQEIEAQVLAHLASKNWSQAERLATSNKRITLLKIVRSQKYLDTTANNQFAKVVAFIDANPKWPEIAKLKVVVEHYLNDKTSNLVIFKWFSKNQPKTAKGYKYYALAAAKLEQDKLKLAQIIKNGWIYGNYTLQEEAQYLSDFGKFLSIKDHVKRIDEHLWHKSVTEAERSFYLVPAKYRAAHLAAIAAINNHSNKDTLFRAIPEQYYTSSLLYHYLQSKKKEKPDAGIVKLLKKVKVDKKHASQWCNLQLYYAREFIDQLDFVSSYNIITTHFASAKEDIREAEWLSGWLALRFLQKPQLAGKHFQKFMKVVNKPISIARGKYWLGRTWEAKGDKQTAIKFYKEASIYPYTFYGQVAHLELKRSKLTLVPMPKALLSHKKVIEKNNVFKATKILLKYGKQELAHTYAKTVAEQAKSEELIWLAQIVKATRNYYYISDFGKHAAQQHIFLKNYAFPTPYKLPNTEVNAAIVYSIIKQESLFNQSAVSTANAMGLMQLVKDTACRTAKAMHARCDIPRLLTDPMYNIKLGTHHLKLLIKERQGSLILTFASYNTASCKVDNWLKRFGDPRRCKNHREVLDWLELIPYYETRNYVQRVLENLQVYRAILNKDSKLKLTEDLGIKTGSKHGNKI